MLEVQGVARAPRHPRFRPSRSGGSLARPGALASDPRGPGDRSRAQAPSPPISEVQGRSRGALACDPRGPGIARAPQSPSNLEVQGRSRAPPPSPRIKGAVIRTRASRGAPQPNDEEMGARGPVQKRHARSRRPTTSLTASPLRSRRANGATMRPPRAPTRDAEAHRGRAPRFWMGPTRPPARSRRPRGGSSRGAP
jgi:hypothetical protein